MNVTDIRALFPGLNGKIYLNTATLNIGSWPARQAYEQALEQWTNGTFDWTLAEVAGEEARQIFAQIIGADAGEVAIVPAVSAAAGLVAASLPDAARGENVVVGAGEFSSNYFPWLMLRERGYEVRTISSSGGASVDGYAAAVDSGTRLVAVSAVHSPNGYRADLAALSAVAHQHDAWLFVDACQAAGAVSIDVRRDGIDLLATSSHKFLLGSRGMGYLFVRGELLDRVRPVFPGWKAGRTPLESFYGPAMDLSPTASRFDASLNWFSALGERASLGIFTRFGIGEILARNAALSARLHERLLEAKPKLPLFPSDHRSTIVSIPVADTDAALAALRQQGVVASVRAGRIRLSVHFYNLEEEIDRVATIVATLS